MRRTLFVALLAAAVLPACTQSMPRTTYAHGLSASPIPGRRVSTAERWMLTDPKAIGELENTTFGEREITEFWARKGWRLTKREEWYLAEVAALVERGALTPISRWNTCPFPIVYQTLERVSVAGAIIERGHEFVLEFDDDEDHLRIGEPRFARAADYVEDHDGGHGPATSR